MPNRSWVGLLFPQRWIRIDGCFMNIEVIDHQMEVIIPSSWLRVFEQAAVLAYPYVQQQALEHSVLDSLDCMDVAIVDQAQSERTHIDFMDVSGATDVITFQHGELVICAAVALSQASEHGEPLERELLRYIIHGMLHLAGHEDAEKCDRDRMEMAQEAIVASIYAQVVFPPKSA